MVLGLSESWGELSREALEGLRAELDQLGAALLLISTGELVCVRPGVQPRAVVRSSRVRQLWPSGLGPWHRAPAANAGGPGCVSARRASLTLALIDEHGVVCWLRRSAQGASSLAQLKEALAQARLQLHGNQRLASGARQRDTLPFSRAELAAGLIAALEATFGEGEARHAPVGAGGAGGLPRAPRSCR